MKKLLFIMNPFAGQKKANKVLPEILMLFTEAGYEINISMTTGPGSATRLAAERGGRADLVVCCGGDGTLNETIAGLLMAGLNVPVGYIPSGTTNDFASSLKLSHNPVQAAKDIIEGQPVPYDVGRFGQRYFCYVASFGAFTKSMQPPEAAFLDTPLWADKDIAALIDENHLQVLENGWNELVIPESMHHITLSTFSPNAVDLGRRLLERGYRACLVGGGMRDLLMGRPSSDYDVATDAPIEVQRELLGDMLELHTVAGGRTFGFVHYPSEVVDLATFQNIPATFQGLPNIPDFDPAELTSTQMLNDSFERDLTINALYYDMDTGDIVDYHDGLYDLREGILNTMADPRICLENDSTIALRALRFKAKFGFDFSEAMEAVMRERTAEFMAQIAPETLAFHLPKFFAEGYAASCFDVLLDYGALPVLFPAVENAWEDESYRQEVMRVLLTIDNRRDALEDGDAAVMAYAAILAYATQADEVDAALDAQAVKYAFAEGEREAVRRHMLALLEVDLPAAA